ncbi:MAG TPA: caspase family protein, partial [Stenomitos sp.]
MAKIALLIGVSEYGSGLHPLPNAVKEVEAMQEVLQPLTGGGFDEVKQLSNPNPPVMREAIETLLSGRTPDDLVLLFFSGHIVWDDSGKLYLATAITPKSPRAELIRVSAIPLNFVHDLMSQSSCQHHVIILDCCLNLVSASPIAIAEEQTLEIQSLFGGEKQSILACFTPIQDSWDARDYPHSIYTRYLVEGIKTGAADLNYEGCITVGELHEYATQRTQIAAPALKPEFYTTEDGDKIVLFKAPLDDPKLKYRRAINSWVSEGKISLAGRSSLDKLAESLGITSQECHRLEAEVLQPNSEYQEKLQQYKRELAKVISYDYPLATPERNQLRIVQQCLGLTEQDVASIEEQMSLRLARLNQAEDEAEPFTPVHSDSQPTVAASGHKTVLQQSTRLLPVEPTSPIPEAEDKAEPFTPVHSESQPTVARSGQKTVLQQSTRLLPVEPTSPIPEAEDEA